MAVYSIWESHFQPEVAKEGREVTKEIWVDMVGYDGYLSHQLLQDLDDPGHLFVISRWESRERADDVLRDYADSSNATTANRLVSQPRRRVVARQLEAVDSP
ncbi:MAG TPA: antibiotic biosynthesis monooxygenase [Acidimicrobiales bacterium]|nr:antibiotic biosynthesis monooxygenase [Acidimicrobiales bacterium]